MRSPAVKGFIAGLLFLLPLMVFQSARREGARLAWDDLRKDEESQMFHWLERTRSFGYFEFKLMDLFALFSRSVPVSDLAEGEAILLDRYRKFIQPVLPKHDLFIVREESVLPSPALDFDGGLGFKNVLGEFLACIRFPVKAKEVEKLRIAQNLAKKMRNGLKLNLLGDSQKRQNGIPQIIRSAEGDRVVYWVSIPRKGHRNNYWTLILYCYLPDFPKDFPFSVQVKTWAVPGCGLIYLPRDQHPPRPSESHGGNISEEPIASRFFREHQDILQDLIEHPPGPRTTAFSEMRGKYLIVVGNALSEWGKRPIVVKSLEAPIMGAQREGQVVFFLLFLICGILVWHVVEHFLFGRRTRFGVQSFLIGAFSLAALLPLSSARFILEQFLVESYRADSQKLKASMRADLEALDEGNRVFQASFTAFLKNFSIIPRERVTLARMREQTPYLASFSRILMEHIARASPIFLSWAFVVGPGGSSWSGRPPDADNPTMPSKPNVLSRVLGRLYFDFLQRRKHILPALATSKKGEKGGLDREAFEEEMFQESISELLGHNVFFRLAHEPLVLSTFKTSSGATSHSGSLIKINGTLEFFIKWFWRNLLLDEVFFQSTLGSDPKTANWEYLTEGLPGTRKPREGFPMRFPDIMRRDPRLANQIRMAFRFGHAVRIKDVAAPGKPYVEILPSDSFVGMLLGRRTTAPIEEKSIETRNWAYLGLAIALLVSLLVGRAGAGYFLGPLQELIRKVGDIRGERFDARMDEGRGDEFGSLARSFNLLAKGLQEGKILERYVSSSVKNAVRGDDPELVRKTAEECLATVLFSGFHKFSEFATTRTGTELIVPLRDHLDAFHEAVKRFGGEIDKMIGDKVMVVFRHPEFPDDRYCVNAALSVVSAVRTRLREQGCPLSLVMGLNSGRVISGILGSPKVRLDHTVIGDPVNLAARLCSLAHTTEGTRVVISGNSLDYLEANSINVRKLPFKSVKGKTQEIEAFLLLE